MASTRTVLSPRPPASGSDAGLIRKKRGVCGGDARVCDTRITVWLLIEWRRLGATDEELLTQYPGLTPEDLHAAWAYARLHPKEIEKAIRENEIV